LSGVLGGGECGESREEDGLDLPDCTDGCGARASAGKCASCEAHGTASSGAGALASWTSSENVAGAGSTVSSTSAVANVSPQAALIFDAALGPKTSEARLRCFAAKSWMPLRYGAPRKGGTFFLNRGTNGEVTSPLACLAPLQNGGASFGGAGKSGDL